MCPKKYDLPEIPTWEKLQQKKQEDRDHKAAADQTRADRQKQPEGRIGAAARMFNDKHAKDTAGARQDAEAFQKVQRDNPGISSIRAAVKVVDDKKKTPGR
jgi:hypothetical protein